MFKPAKRGSGSLAPVRTGFAVCASGVTVDNKAQLSVAGQEYFAILLGAPIPGCFLPSTWPRASAGFFCAFGSAALDEPRSAGLPEEKVMLFLCCQANVLWPLDAARLRPVQGRSPHPRMDATGS